MHDFQRYFSRTYRTKVISEVFPGPGTFKKKIKEAWEPDLQPFSPS